MIQFLPARRIINPQVEDLLYVVREGIGSCIEHSYALHTKLATKRDRTTPRYFPGSIDSSSRPGVDPARPVLKKGESQLTQTSTQDSSRSKPSSGGEAPNSPVSGGRGASRGPDGSTGGVGQGHDPNAVGRGGSRAELRWGEVEEEGDKPPKHLKHLFAEQVGVEWGDIGSICFLEQVGRDGFFSDVRRSFDVLPTIWKKGRIFEGSEIGGVQLGNGAMTFWGWSRRGRNY